MKNNSKIEVILFSKYSLTDPDHRDLVKWLGTTLQPAIRQQEELVQKFSLKTLKETPAIFLS